MRSAGAEQLFSKKTNVQQVRNNHFSKKHAFSRCGTTIFLKNMRSAGAEQLFSEKHTFQGVGTTVFEKNKRSKGLEQLFSKKIHVPRGWNNHFQKKHAFQGVGRRSFVKKTVIRN